MLDGLDRLKLYTRVHVSKHLIKGALFMYHVQRNFNIKIRVDSFQTCGSDQRGNVACVRVSVCGVWQACTLCPRETLPQLLVTGAFPHWTRKNEATHIAASLGRRNFDGILRHRGQGR